MMDIALSESNLYFGVFQSSPLELPPQPFYIILNINEIYHIGLRWASWLSYIQNYYFLLHKHNHYHHHYLTNYFLLHKHNHYCKHQGRHRALKTNIIATILFAFVISLTGN